MDTEYISYSAIESSAQHDGLSAEAIQQLHIDLNRNGFAVVTLGSDGDIMEEFYEAGIDTPVWSK